MSTKFDAFDNLFEVSWEVCNKVGGIYEVVTSKVLQAKEEFNDNYFLIGPSLKVNPGFEESNDPEWLPIKQALASKDLKCRLGRWNIPGNPRVILVDFASRYNKNQILRELWEKYGVDSLLGGFDYEEPVLFSYTCGEVIATIWESTIATKKKSAIAHFHEWMCGAGLLATKTFAPEIATVFTTHATMLGRALAGSGIDIYKHMKNINSKKEAAMHGIIAKCSMEQVSAREADAFTTVSYITAEEAENFLHKRADVITTNGLDLRVMPDYSKERQLAADARMKLLKPIERLLRRKVPDNIKIAAISGRYEYHNKGVDVFLEALSKINKDLEGTEVHILALCLVMGGHTGLNHEIASGDPNIIANPNDDSSFVTPFYVYNEANDSILNACKKLGLNNSAKNNVQVVFVPAMLDGHDGFFNMEYFEILAGCDLSVFPSWYEPWGYTPHEAAAYGVPTITTDLSGFGIWVRDLEAKNDFNVNGVTVISRKNYPYENVVSSLEQSMLEYIKMPEARLLEYRKSARLIAEQSTWESFYPKYCEAYALACDKAMLRGKNRELQKKQNSKLLAASCSTTPLLRMITAVAELPSDLSRLRELALNLWWAWNSDARKLFYEIDPALWEKVGRNPLMMIERADPDRLVELTQNITYMDAYAQVLEKFDEYMAEPIKSFNTIDRANPVAYFCCEFGIHESLPIYSGGLGILAGDHMKSVSDLALPVVGIGLLYRNGYFRQQINKEGRQVAIYPYNDFSTLPVEPLCDVDKKQIVIELELPGRILYMAVWEVKVGRAKIYLLDTDIPKNTDEDRGITARLYEADRDVRLRQEIVLGIGGVRLCYRLGLTPSVFHMNEGHSAFLILERIRKHVLEDKMTLEEAIEFVSGSCVLTTHTPVAAGNERFTVDQISRYFTSWAHSMGLSWQEFLTFGAIEGHEDRHFDMTVFGLKFSNKSNAVSWLHGEVSRRMWKECWKGLVLPEIPISHVTNGIHTPSFVGFAFREVLTKFVSHKWDSLPTSDKNWDKIYDIPDEVLLNAKKSQKRMLTEKVKKDIPAFVEKYGIDRSYFHRVDEFLNTNSLIIGFARRFATYKRANLLFSDPDRLANILNHTDRPVVFLFSGKSHPADESGISLIQEVIKYSKDPRFQGKIFFVEDYSLIISKALVQGCDVWLNNPRRPHEASGTSGQKVPVNGGINLSVSDGWWCEGYDGTNGWTIGPDIKKYDNNFDMQSDYLDAEALYVLLEEKIIPTYYDRNKNGISAKWMQIMKNSMRTLTAEYSTHRMLEDYIETMYCPTADRAAELTKENYKLARENAKWRVDIAKLFNSVRINDIQLSGISGDTLVCGQPFNVEVNINPGEMPLENLDVQLVIGEGNGEDFTSKPDIVHLKLSKPTNENLLYTGTYKAKKNGRYVYGIRVLPVKEGLTAVRNSPAILWG